MKTILHMIGNAHLDPVWLWTWQEGFMEAIATFRSALDRIAESEDFVFTASSAQYYKWIEEHDPAMFAEIRAAVAAGRWNIVGGWWIQPDDNMPDGESFARQGLYSQRYYRERFGVVCKTGYCVDTFGHSAEIPKLLRGARMENFVFMRPGRHENPDVPPLFWWDAADGSRVLTFQIQNGYCDRKPEEGAMRALTALADETGCDMMCFYGVGNHGGGPTRRQIEAIRRVERDELPGRVALSDPDTAFDAIRSQNPDLPVWKTELQHHASGCYSAASEIKREMRRTERTLLAAEAFCAAADSLGVAAYPAARFAEAWENVMFNQFHDIMCGCSAKIGLDEAVEMYHESRAFASKLLHKTLGGVCKRIDTMLDGATNAGKSDWQLWEEDDHGVPVVVFNPLAWEYAGYITVNARLASVCDPAGNPVQLQYVWGDTANGTELYDTMFPVRLPPLGYAVYWAYKNKVVSEACAASLPVVKPREELYLENDYLRADFDPATGHITRLYDKERGVVVNDGDFAVPVIVDDTRHDTWAHGVFVFRDELARLDADSVRYFENGPLGDTIRVNYTYGESHIRFDFSLARGEKQIGVRMKSMWQANHTIVKLAFPLAARDCAAAAQIPFGRIERPANAEEEPMLMWCDLTGDVGGAAYGLTVANDGRYSYDAFENELRVTLLRNCIYGDHFASERAVEYDQTDEGVRYLNLALLPHAGKPDGAADRRAAELNARPVAVFDSYHKGTLGRTGSFASVGCGHVQLAALKGAENGEGYVARLWETAGQPADCVFRCFGAETRLAFRPLEVKTLRLRDGVFTETDFIED